MLNPNFEVCGINYRAIAFRPGLALLFAGTLDCYMRHDNCWGNLYSPSDLLTSMA